MLLQLSHLLRMPLQSQRLYLGNARGPVRFENHGEQLGYYIVEFIAFFWVFEFIALATRGNGFFRAASPYFAPLCLYVFMATGTFFLEISPAGATVQTAIRRQSGIRNNVSHDPLLCEW